MLKDFACKRGGRRITPQMSGYGWPCSIGNIRMNQPGHYFTLRIFRQPPAKKQPVNRLAIGVVSSEFVPPHYTEGYGKADAKTTTLWCFDGKVGARGSGHDVTLSSVPPFQTGDEITVTVGSDPHADSESGSGPGSESGSGSPCTDLWLRFALNGKEVFQLKTADIGHCCVPFVRVPPRYVLDLVRGVGEPLEEPPPPPPL